MLLPSPAPPSLPFLLRSDVGKFDGIKFSARVLLPAVQCAVLGCAMLLQPDVRSAVLRYAKRGTKTWGSAVLRCAKRGTKTWEVGYALCGTERGHAATRRVWRC